LFVRIRRNPEHYGSKSSFIKKSIVKIIIQINTVIIMKGNFDKLINGEKPVLIDFHAEWCGPCKALAPIIKEVAKEMSGKVRVVKIDIDKNQPLAQRYQVRGVPTLALFKDGAIIWRESGVQTKHQIVSNVEAKIK